MPGNSENFSAAMHAAERQRWDSHWANALQEYQKALAEFPEDATARNGLGLCYIQMKQWQPALYEYESILQREPGNIIALSKAAELYVILNRRSDGYQAYLHLADLYSQAGQGARAEATWQKAVQLSPGDPEPHERLANYYFEKKDIPQMLQERLAAAQGYLLRNELGLARMHCEEVLRADEANIQANDLLTQIMASVHQNNGTGSPGNDSLTSSDQLAFTEQPFTETVTLGNTSGGNTGIMGNMGSAGSFGGGQNSAPSATVGGAMSSAPRKKITANQVTGALQQAQTFQNQGRFDDAIDLCEQILESGFDRPDARYFLGWLYQEQQRWDDAIQQFQLLLNDPDYALSCYYALGQCYRARGDLRTATIHFDEAVDRVNLDALTAEESDQLVQLCQEAAEAHRLLGEQEQALTVYNALLGFLRSRGWSDKVAQVEFMLQQAQNAPAPTRPTTPPPGPVRQEQMGGYMQAPASPSQVPEAPTMEISANNLTNLNGPANASNSSVGELPDWLTGILNDSEKTQTAPPKQSVPAPKTNVPPPPTEMPTMEQRIPTSAPENRAQPAPRQPSAPLEQPYSAPQPAQPAAQAPAIPSWLTDDSKPNATRILPEQEQPYPVAQPAPQAQPAQPVPQAQPVQPPQPPSQPLQQVAQPVQQPPQAAIAPVPAPAPIPAAPQPVPPIPPAARPQVFDDQQLMMPNLPGAVEIRKPGIEELLSQMAGSRGDGLNYAADAVLTSTAMLPENVRVQVVRSMQDIQSYINHGLLNSATEECLRVIDIAPQYLDVHQILCEIYVREGRIEQAITKYAILVDTYIVNGRIDDAIATYRRILQLEPNNLTYRMRLINLLSTQGNKEDLLRERTLAAESYLRLGYMDRAMTELEQALQESPTSVPTRLNYALALQKLGRSQQAIAEYQRVLQIDPRNITALVRWHIAMITSLGMARSTTLEVLTRIRWQLRGEGQKHADAILREYTQSADIYPNNSDVHYSLGQIYHQCGLFDRALDEYTLAMRDSSVEILARTSAAQALLTQGKPEAAIQQLEQALQQVRRSPHAMDPATWAARPREEGEEHQAPEVEISMQLAKAYGRTGRQEQMQAILRQVKQGRPEQNEVSSSIAEISARQGDIGSTLQEYSELVRHYRQSRQTDNALNVLNEMVRLAPQDPRAHSELADIYVSRGLLDEGMAELRLLADIDLRLGRLEEAAEALQQVGNIYAEMGNTEEALANLVRAVELKTDSIDMLREVVGFYLQLGRNSEAARYQSRIARHYFETQQVKEAVAALQQLITIDRSDYEAYDMLGQTYQSVGEYEQASRVYRNLAKVNPGSSIARERLTTLQELRAR